jgi:DNA-binding Xre family transcriptional regulator
LPDNSIDRYTWTETSATRLKTARGNMSRYELSKRLMARLGCFGKNEISKFERGQKQTIKAELLTLICEELNVSVGYVIYGENDD